MNAEVFGYMKELLDNGNKWVKSVWYTTNYRKIEVALDKAIELCKGGGDGTQTIRQPGNG